MYACVCVCGRRCGMLKCNLNGLFDEHLPIYLDKDAFKDFAHVYSLCVCFPNARISLKGTSRKEIRYIYIYISIYIRVVLLCHFKEFYFIKSYPQKLFFLS